MPEPGILAEYQNKLHAVQSGDVSGSRYKRLRLAAYYERAIKRVEGDWSGGTGNATGREFARADHQYAADLHVIGEGSLFELLCVTRTSIGQRGLANYLLEHPSIDEVLARQEAIRELRPRTELREQVALLGKFDFLESKWNTFDNWLQSPSFEYPQWLPAVLLANTALIFIVALAGVFHFIPWASVQTWIVPLLAIQGAVGLSVRERVNAIAEAARPASVETEVLRAGLTLLGETQFESAKLRHLSELARNGSATVRGLERLLNALQERQKEWFYLPSLVLMIGTQMCMAIEKWRRAHTESLKVWLSAWAEFEALNALATYAHENPENTFPELAIDEAIFEAKAMRHPLLPAGSCIANDVALNGAARFYVISGSNMSGKSTLLRAIGLNAVLAFAGAPVRAASMRLSPVPVFASISIADSLQNGKSKFLAEIDRLRGMIEASQNAGSVLFLIDEILSGTNSHDRRVATEAVIRTLVGRGAVGALSTHDLALCEIAEMEGLTGVNVHMGSQPGGGPLDFDYRLKPGVTEESNALAIARMAGVPT
jgi:hypothetical protein